MADETNTTSEVARVLLLHASFKATQGIQEPDAPWWWECDGCDTKVAQGGTGRNDTFSGLAKHQAAMLAEAGLLREVAPARDPECPCAACDPGMILPGDSPIWFPSRMNVCPDCGNKRCPKAANHAKWQCGGSNETGQQGVPVAAGATQDPSGDSRASGGLGGATWPFAPGDVVRDSGEDGDHAAWLDAAPQKTVLVDSQGTEWVRLGDGWFLSDPPVRASRWASLNLERTYGPLSVISVGTAP